jgi:hypothetical protein
MKMKRNALVMLAIGLMAAGAASAQDTRPQMDPKMMEALKELHTTLKSWAQSNVIPSLKSWKVKLDGSMTAADLNSLNGLRARAAELRKDMMSAGMAMHGARKSENYDAMKESRDKMKELGDKRKAIMQELKPLAEKYRPTLESIGQEAKPKLEEWKKSGMEIAQKWYQDHKDVIGDRGAGMMRHGFGMMGHLDEVTRRKIAVAYFMLWDGGDPMEQLQQDLGAPNLN